MASGVDRGGRNDSRQRRALQKLAANAFRSLGITTGSNGITIDEDAGTISLDLRDTDPGLELSATGLGILLGATPGLTNTGGLAIDLDTNSGLVLGAGGIAIDLDTDPGLVLGAGGIKILLPGSSGLVLGATGLLIDLDTDPGLVLGAGGIKVQINGTSLTLGASGLSVTAPDGQRTVTSVKTGTYTAVIGETVRCDPSGAGFTVNLPTAVGVAGRRIVIKNTTSSTNVITITPNGAQTIDTAAGTSINTAFGVVRLESDGANWMVV